MNTSDSYSTIETMIKSGKVMLSDLERLLDSLQKQAHITPHESEALLELAWSESASSAPTA